MLAINGSPEFTGLRVTVSVGFNRPLARLVRTRCVPVKIKFKRYGRRLLTWLTEHEVDALLAALNAGRASWV